MKEISREGGPKAVRRLGRKKAQEAKRKRPRGDKTIYARRRALALVAAVVGLVLVGAVAGAFLTGGGEIRRGVSVGDVDVGGMTREEARAAVERDASKSFEKIDFGNGVSLTGERLGVKADSATAVDKAYAVGREGGVIRRVSDVVGAYFGGVQVDLDAGYEKKVAAGALDEVARKFYKKPKDASFSVTDDGKVEVSEARNGRVLDKEATLANLDRSLEDMKGKVAPVEGPAPKPEVTTAEVEKYAPREVIGEYKTDFLWDSNKDRQENMRMAAEAVNDTVLKPGEVFSFNELTSTLDYKKAKTYSDGGIGYEAGGGLCQVSSTLYMATQYAGLESVERWPHYATLPYIRPGFDATVWFGDAYGNDVLDMKFKNTTDGYIVVREYVDEKGILTAQILGQPTGKKVKMRSEKDFEDLNVGIQWSTYKTVTDENGKVIRDGLLHKDLYSYQPPAPEGLPKSEVSVPRVGSWPDPTNTTGWATPHD